MVVVELRMVSGVGSGFIHIELASMESSQMSQ